jgi:hypothetical protein
MDVQQEDQEMTIKIHIKRGETLITHSTHAIPKRIVADDIIVEVPLDYPECMVVENINVQELAECWLRERANGKHA